MRIFMTGTRGFLGRPVASLLLASGHAVGALARPDGDRAGRPAFPDGITPVPGKLEDASGLRAALADFAPDTVIHAGWSDVSAGGRNAPDQLRNAVMAAKLAELAAEIGVRAFIGIGSQAEYGPMDRAIDETETPRPTSLYGIAKLAAALSTERICAAAGMRWAWLRLFCAYGPHDHASCLIPTLMRHLMAGERPALTACEQRWDFLHVDDAAAAVVAVATTPHAAGTFNLGSGQAPPLRETVERVRDMINPTLPLGFGERPYGPDQTMHLQADIRRLSEATGWHPRIPLREGLNATFQWHAAQSRTHHAPRAQEG